MKPILKIKFADGKTQDVLALKIVEVNGRQLFFHSMVHPNGAIDRRFCRLTDIKTGVAITGGFAFQFSALKYAEHFLTQDAIIKLDGYPQINELCNE